MGRTLVFLLYGASWTSMLAWRDGRPSFVRDGFWGLLVEHASSGGWWRYPIALSITALLGYLAIMFSVGSSARDCDPNPFSTYFGGSLLSTLGFFLSFGTPQGLGWVLYGLLHAFVAICTGVAYSNMDDQVNTSFHFYGGPGGHVNAQRIEREAGKDPAANSMVGVILLAPLGIVLAFVASYVIREVR